MNFFDLPTVVLYEVFDYLTYDEIAKKRIVSRRFNELCSQLLNSGFNKATRQHADLYKRIKTILPRRESERRQHFLARHAEILNSLETRISMLSMTYSKYIDRDLCCFIPGKVLDELMRVLRLIAKTQEALRPHEILQELRDLSSMAIEHFDEHFTDKYNAIILSRGREQQQPAMPSSSLADISFSGMNRALMYEHSYPNMPASSPLAGAANSALPQAPLAAPLNALINYQEQASTSAAGDNQDANNSYYAYSPEDLIRQRINHLLYLPNDQLMQHLLGMPMPSVMNNNYDAGNYWNRYSTNRTATIEELNNLSLYCSAMQLKVTETVGSLNTLVRQLQKELITKNEQIAKLEARMATVDKLQSKVSHLSHKMRQKFGEVRAEVGGVRADVEQINSNVEQINSNVDQKFDEVRAEVGGVRADVEQKFEEVSANVEQINSNVEQKFGEVRAEVGGVRAEVGGVRAEVGGVKAEVGGVRAEVGEVKADVEQQFQGVKADVEQKFQEVTSNVEQINTAVVEVTADVQQIKQINTTVEHRIGQVQEDVEQINSVVQKFGDVAVHVVQKFANYQSGKINEMKSEMLNKSTNDVKTECESDIKQLTDNVDSIIDEVRTELCSNILQIHEEIRTKQHFPGTVKPECHQQGQCCAECCAYRAIKKEGDDEENDAPKEEQALAAQSAPSGTSTPSKKRPHSELVVDDTNTNTDSTPQKRSCPSISAGHLTKSLDPHTAL